MGDGQDPRWYFVMFRRWRWLIALGAVLSAGISFLMSKQMSRVYEALATLLLRGVAAVVVW